METLGLQRKRPQDDGYVGALGRNQL
jgi:hypothetical protein